MYTQLPTDQHDSQYRLWNDKSTNKMKKNKRREGRDERKRNKWTSKTKDRTNLYMRVRTHTHTNEQMLWYLPHLHSHTCRQMRARIWQTNMHILLTLSPCTLTHFIVGLSAPLSNLNANQITFFSPHIGSFLFVLLLIVQCVCREHTRRDETRRKRRRPRQRQTQTHTQREKWLLQQKR